MIPPLSFFVREDFTRMKPGITSFRFLDEAEHDEQDRMIRDALNELAQVSIALE